jgi:hypothetical protein
VTEVAQTFGLLFTVAKVMHYFDTNYFDKIGFGQNLADFFTNSSGHSGLGFF